MSENTQNVEEDQDSIFENHINSSLSEDYLLRTQGEEFLTTMRSTESAKYCLSLVKLCKKNADSQTTKLSKILLFKADFSNLPREVLDKIKLVLFDELKQKKPRQTIFKAWRNLYKETNEDLIADVLTWAENDNPNIRYNAIDFLAHNVDKYELQTHFTKLKKIIQNGLINDDMLQISFQLASELFISSDKVTLKELKDLFPLMIQALGTLMKNTNCDMSQNIDCLMSLLDIAPRFFATQIANIMPILFHIAKTTEFDNMTRTAALNAIADCAAELPGAMKKLPLFAESLVPLCMDLMLEIEERDDWCESYGDDTDEEISIAVSATEALDQITIALDGKGFQPVILRVVPQFLNHSNWKHRVTGLQVIGITIEGCKEAFRANIELLVNSVIKMFSDSHERVRFAAVENIGHILNDFEGLAQEKFHQLIIPALLKATSDPVAPVQAHAARCFVNFIEACESSVWMPYRDAIIVKSCHMLHSEHQFVKEQALAAISAVTNGAQQEIVNYYEQIMNAMKSLVSKPQTFPVLINVITSVSCMAVSVGAEKFSPDIPFLAKLLQEARPDQSIVGQIQEVWFNWTQFAKCLKEQFAPYLPMIMPALFEPLERQIEEIGDEDSTGSQSGVDTQQLTLELAELASSAISKLLSTSPLAMHSYVERIIQAFENSKLFQKLDPSSLLLAIKSKKIAVEANQASQSDLDSTMRRAMSLLISLRTDDSSSAIQILETISQCLQLLPNNFLEDEQINHLLENAARILHDNDRKKQQRDEENEEEPVEEDEEETLCEDLYFIVADVVGKAIKSHIHATRLFISTWLTTCQQLLSVSSASYKQQAALCLLCDFVEFCGEAQHFSSPIVSAFLAYATDDNPNSRQAALYGLGIAAQKLGTSFDVHAAEAVQRLKAAVLLPNSSSEQFSGATINAISALFKMVPVHKAGADDILDFCVQHLPVEGADAEEAKLVHAQFVHHVSTFHPAIVGTQFNKIEKVLKIFANLVGTIFICEETEIKIRDTIKHLQKVVPPQVLQQAWVRLSTLEKQGLQKALQQ